MLAPVRTSRLLGRGCCAPRDGCHMHTDFYQVTDAGFKAFSAALASSSSITEVELRCKFEWLVCWYEWGRVSVCMRVCGVWMWWGVAVCVGSARRVDVGAGPYQQLARAWVLRSSWGLALITDTRIQTLTSI